MKGRKRPFRAIFRPGRGPSHASMGRTRTTHRHPAPRRWGQCPLVGPHRTLPGTPSSCVALDFRGHGDSDYPQNLEVGAFNTDLEALCRSLGTSDVVIVGHSMGAQVALDHASRFEETGSLILIDPARGGEKRTRRVARLALSLARSYSTREEAIERFRFIPAAEHALEPLRHHIAAHSVQQKEDGTWGFKFDGRWFGIASRPAPDLSRIQCPCLIVRGEESHLLSAEAATLLCGEIPQAELTEIKFSGHHVLLDQARGPAFLGQ